MIFGIVECSDTRPTERKTRDLLHIKQLFEFLGAAPEFSTLFRVGRYTPGKNRPLKAILHSEKDVQDIVKNAKRLKDADMYKGVSLSFDRTPRQHNLYKACRRELQERTARDEEGLRIKFISGTPKVVTLN